MSMSDNALVKKDKNEQKAVVKNAWTSRPRITAQHNIHRVTTSRHDGVTTDDSYTVYSPIEK